MANSERTPRYFSAIQQHCDAHGEYVSLLMPGGWSGCVGCDQQAECAAHDAEQESWRRELSARAWQARRGRAAIPDRFADKRLSTYVPTGPGGARALQVATRYASNFAGVRKAGTSLIFCGERGTGKTHLATSIAHEVLEQGGLAVFTSVIGAVRSVKETYAKGSGKTEAQAIRDLVEPDLLILDEVGVQFGSDTEKMVLFEIINGRYETCRPTIVISNLALAALEEYLGARAFDRLREGNGMVVVFDWETFRSRRVDAP